MEKLKILVDGNEKMIEADKKIGTGIYAVTDSNVVKNNIQKLNIRFDETSPDNVLQNKVSKIGNWSFLTLKAVNNYLQYIFMPSASQNDFNTFLKNIDDPTMQKMLIDTYNMSKLTATNLDTLSDLDKNRN